MNLVALTGRLTKNPDYHISGGDTQKEIARFTVAVDRDAKDAGADFISCVAFGNTAHFVQQYFMKGSKIELEGRIQTGSYEKNGQKYYTTDVVANKVKFGESKAEAEARGTAVPQSANDTPIGSNEFMNIADGVAEELPFT